MAEAREALTKVSIEVGRCGLTYGEFPCRALLVGDVVPAIEYFFNGTNDGWTAANGTATPELYGTVLQGSGSGNATFSVSGLSISGSANQKVSLDVTRETDVGAGTWVGQLQYTTSGHGFSTSFYKSIGVDFSALPVGERTRIDLDMSALDVGGSNWTSSTITGLRLIFESAGTRSFKIHTVSVGHAATSDEATGTAKCFNSRSTCQDPDHYDLDDVPIAAIGAKIEAYKASPATSTVNITGRSFGAEPADGQVRRILATVEVYAAAGAPALNSATIGSLSAIVRSSQISGTVGVYHVESSADVTGTTGSVNLVFAASVDHIAMVTYRIIDGEYVSSSSSTTLPDPSLNRDVPSKSQVFASMASYLMSTTVWSGVTEDSDDSQGTDFRFTSGSYFRLESTTAAARTITADDNYTQKAAPTVTSTVSDSGDTVATLVGTGLSGDIVLVAVEHRENTLISTPSGMTILGATEILTAASTRLTVYWMRLSGTSFSINVGQASNQDHVFATAVVIRGCVATGNPFETFTQGQQASGSTTITIPGVTTTIDHALVVDIVGRTDDNASAWFSSWTNANLSTMTEVSDAGTTNTSGGGIGINTGVKLTPGATGSTTVTSASTTGATFFKIAFVAGDYALSKNAMVVSEYSWAGREKGTLETMVFAKPSAYRPEEPDVYPLIDDVKYTSATIAPGEDLGDRAVMQLVLADAPHNDAGPGLDKYHDERGYSPYERGTFFGRFRSRYPDIRNRNAVWSQGFVDQDEADWEHRTLVMESFSGPGEDGRFTITAHDPLKLLDGDRAQCPALSEGRLIADIDDVATAFTLTPVGIGETYPTSGFGTIGGSEVVSFTRVADAMTIVRAQKNTKASTHKAADRFQLMKSWSAADSADIIYELMNTFALVPAEWLPLADWLAETAAYLRRVFTADIAEPTSVTQLVAELMEQAGLSIWWDPIGAQVRLRVLRAIPTSTEGHTEQIFETNSFRIREQTSKRVSQVWTFYGPISPIAQLDDKANYRSSVMTIDLDAEVSYGASKIKKIFSRWISEGGRSAAERVNSLQIARYRVPPRLFSYSLFRGAQTNPELGLGYTVGHPVLQDASGARVQVPVQVIGLVPSPVRFSVQAEEFNYETLDEEDLANRFVTIDAKTYDLNLRNLHDDLYSPPRTGDNVTFIIEPGVIVGSTSHTTPAIDVGTWPTIVRNGTKASTSNGIITGLADTSDLAVGILVRGTGIQANTRILTIDSPTQVTLDKNSSSTGTVSLTFYLVNVTLENHGRIQGRGGPGGQGANDNGQAGSGDRNGKQGGTALYARYYFVLVDADGKEYGGGGGGAGGSCADFDDHRGGGGGGGAGDVGGLGGTGPGNGEEGAAGTLDAGGAGGRSYTSSNFWTGPSLRSNVRGGNGGSPGAAGSDDIGNYSVSGGSPGAAGNSIDGVSYINQSGSAGTRLGPTVN